jgi:hypothetical protein
MKETKKSAWRHVRIHLAHDGEYVAESWKNILMIFHVPSPAEEEFAAQLVAFSYRAI